jgi:hypothetical protein
MTLREMINSILDTNIELPQSTGLILGILGFIFIGIPGMFEHIKKLRTENPEKDYSYLIRFYIILSISLLGFCFYTMTL